MQYSYQELTKLLAFDPGRRHIPTLASADALAGATRVLVQARKVVLLSGFYIGRASAWETDGPLGTLALAATLQRAGKEPVIFTDTGALDMFAAGMRVLNLKTPLLGFGPGMVPGKECLLQQQPEAVIAIERNGRALDGKYYNSSGVDVTRHIAHFDGLFAAATDHGIDTIAVGDGGNEIGFGDHLPQVQQLLGRKQKIACITPAKYLIACGVSNWGGYALAALTAWHTRNKLPLDQALLTELLQEIVTAGAVDGVSGQGTATVDGLPLAIELAMFSQLTTGLASLASQVAGENN